MNQEYYEIEVKVKFRAGHRLIKDYVGHCNNVHGEGYTVILFFRTPKLDSCGMVFDFGSIKKKIKSWIDEKLDHSYMFYKEDEIGHYLKSKGMKTFEMNDNPTAENISKLIYDEVKKITDTIYRVGVVESFEDSIAWYENTRRDK